MHIVNYCISFKFVQSKPKTKKAVLVHKQFRRASPQIKRKPNNKTCIHATTKQSLDDMSATLCLRSSYFLVFSSSVDDYSVANKLGDRSVVAAATRWRPCRRPPRTPSLAPTTCAPQSDSAGTKHLHPSIGHLVRTQAVPSGLYHVRTCEPTWVVRPESNGRPSSRGNADGVSLDRVDEVELRGRCFGVVVADAPSHHEEVVAV